MKRVNIGILGATGAVGTTMIQLMDERSVPCTELRLLADKSDAGKKINFRGEELVVSEATNRSFDDLDILLVAVSNEVSKLFSPIAVEKGAIVIDNSSAYRMDPDVPLVIPEINPEDVKIHKGIIANPNCSTTIALMAVNPLYREHKVTRMIVSTYQSVSGAGINGINELEQQVKDYAHGNPLQNHTFEHQIAFNLIPHIDVFLDNGYTKEELKMMNESRRILHDEKLRVSCTCVRVPVFQSHSISIHLEFAEVVSIEAARRLFSQAKGIKFVDDPQRNLYPMPIDTTNQDLVFVGRLRKDLTEKKALNLWCCGDQVRKGAATNAIQIAELVIKEYFS